jgi:UDP-galactopyranose mutase
VDHSTVIIGAGPTGLGTAYHLDGDYLILEREGRPGGLCRSNVEGPGFVFDYAGHIIFSQDAYYRQLLDALLPDNIHWQDREAWVHSKGVYTRYPFQASTFGLPVEVVKECVLGAVDAIHNTRNLPEPRTFEEWIARFWGDGIARHFMVPYNRKLWAVPLSEMAFDWLGGRVPQPNLEEILEGALRPQPKPMGPNARFGYPLRGGFESLVRGLAGAVGPIRPSSAVTRISLARRTVTVNGRDEIAFGALVSTMPLPELEAALDGAPPRAVREAFARLRTTSILCVNLGVDRAGVTDKHWIYYPEDTVFHRIFVQSNASPHNAPRGTSSFIAEVSYGPNKPIARDGLVERVRRDAVSVGFLKPSDDVISASVYDLPYAYVVPTVTRLRDVETIKCWLEEHDVYTAGRFGEWAYYNSDHSILAGRKLAERLNAARRGGPTETPPGAGEPARAGGKAAA